jgi:hypothetical protein
MTAFIRDAHEGYIAWVVLPTAAHGKIRSRCIAKPDAAQAALLDASASSCRPA